MSAFYTGELGNKHKIEGGIITSANELAERLGIFEEGMDLSRLYFLEYSPDYDGDYAKILADKFGGKYETDYETGDAPKEIDGEQVAY